MPGGATPKPTASATTTTSSSSAAPQFNIDVNGAAVSASLKPGQQPLYWGDVVTPGLDAADRKSGKSSIPSTITVDEATMKFNDPGFMTDADRVQLGQTLYRAGVISDPGNYDAIQAYWAKAVQDAAEKYHFGQQITPMQVITMKLAMKTPGAPGAPTSSTTTSVNVPSPQDAEGLVRSIYQTAMGRDPSKNELAKYSALLVGVAQKNPSVTKSTSKTAGGHTDTTNTSTGGIGQTAMENQVLDKIKVDPEYGAYQAATTYYNAMLQAIASPV